RLNIEAADIAHTNHVANQVGSGWELHVGRGRCANQEVHLCGFDVSLLEQAAYGFSGHVRSSEAISLKNVALFDPRAFGNPGVARIDHTRELSVREQVRWQVAMDGSNRGAWRWGQRLESGWHQ